MSERAYNARGSLSSVTGPFFEGDAPETTSYTYDAFDRVVSIVPPDGKAVSKSYGLWTETTIDPKQKAVTSERGTTFGIERSTIEGEAAVTRQDFAMLGRRRKLTDTRNNIWT